MLTLAQAVRAVLAAAGVPLSPGQIRDEIKQKYPYLYGTQVHLDAIARGNFQNEDHALLNPIYSIVTRGDDFVTDRTSKPMRISLVTEDTVDDSPAENYEADLGVVYVLATGLFTQEGREILKIGHTTQPLETRISQLYTTGTPYQFKELKSWRVRNYTELEQALHRLLAPFRVNRAREFFTDNAMPFVDRVVGIHSEVQAGVKVASA